MLRVPIMVRRRVAALIRPIDCLDVIKVVLRIDRRTARRNQFGVQPAAPQGMLRATAIRL